MNICLLHKGKTNTSDLRKYFLNTKYVVQEISVSEDGVNRLEDTYADVIIFDAINQKGESSDISLLQRVQKITKTIPILLATNSSESASYRESMLDAGVDSCVQAPFLEEELHLRVEKLLRKKDSLLFQGTDISASDVVMDIRSHIVEKSGEVIALTKTEYSILQHLFLRKNNIVSNSELTSCLDEKTKEDSLALNIHIFNLRKKVRNENLIKTVPLYGFMVSDAMRFV